MSTLGRLFKYLAPALHDGALFHTDHARFISLLNSRVKQQMRQFPETQSGMTEELVRTRRLMQPRARMHDSDQRYRLVNEWLPTYVAHSQKRSPCRANDRAAAKQAGEREQRMGEIALNDLAVSSCTYCACDSLGRCAAQISGFLLSPVKRKCWFEKG